MFIPRISSFKITLSSKFPMYYLFYLSCHANFFNPSVQVCYNHLTTWSMLSSASLYNLHRGLFCLLSIFILTKFVLILWFCPVIIRLSVSLFKSPFWSKNLNFLTDYFFSLSRIPNLLSFLLPILPSLLFLLFFQNTRCFYAIYPTSAMTL